MSTTFRKLVSKQKKRYEANNYNLDLSYITPRIIAMGVPAQTIERIYRNDIAEVSRFLDEFHRDNYKVYNLCHERTYDCKKFHNRVKSYPMHDHCPPSIHIIPYFCNDVYRWLQESPDHLVAVHCKAGKGRTGVMICCFLLYESYERHLADPTIPPKAADEVLELYDNERTYNGKGVTIPSQRRYVYYYSHILREHLTVQNEHLVLKSATLEILPLVSANSSTGFMFRCKKLVRNCNQNNRNISVTVGESDVFEPKCKSQTFLTIVPPVPLSVFGDMKMIFMSKTKFRQEKLFHFWINTYFVRHQPTEAPGVRLRREGYVSNAPPGDPGDLFLTLTKAELDSAVKDKNCKNFTDDFAVTLQFGEDNNNEEFGLFSNATGQRGDGGSASPIQGDFTSSSCSSSSEESGEETPNLTTHL